MNRFYNRSVNKNTRQVSVFKFRDKFLFRSFRYIPGEWLLVELKSGQLRGASRDFCSLVGISRRELLKKNIEALSCGNSDFEWKSKEFNLELLLHPGRYEDVSLNAFNEPLTIDIWITHIANQGKKIAFCLITDRSHLRQLQDELIKKHRQLQRAVVALEERTNELEQARNELRVKNREVGRLSAQTMSTNTLSTIGEITAELTHQLNNPLAAAIGAYRKLNRLYSAGKTENIKSTFDLLNTALNRMKDTIEEVHVIYKHSRIPIKPMESINVIEHINSALALMEQRLINCELIMDYAKEIPEVLAHKLEFLHVLINLIDNAIDASREKGILKIEVDAIEDKVSIKISDNGPGVPLDLRIKIFETFYSTKEKGSGIGLAAVKRYVERDKSSIVVGDSDLGGACFTLLYEKAKNKRKQQ